MSDFLTDPPPVPKCTSCWNAITWCSCGVWTRHDVGNTSYLVNRDYIRFEPQTLDWFTATFGQTPYRSDDLYARIIDASGITWTNERRIGKLTMSDVDRMAGGPHRSIIDAYVERMVAGIDSEWGELNL